MRTNHKRRCNDSTTHSYILLPSICIVLAIAIGFGVKLFIDTKCSDLGKSIRALENELISLRKDYAIQQNAWAETTKPANLEIALNKHGLNMDSNQSDKFIVSLNGPAPSKRAVGNGTAYAKNK